MNESQSDVSVLAWQLGLRIVAQEGATGTMQFDAISPAPQPLFGEASAPGCDPSNSPPGDSIFCQDVDDEFGEVIPALESREILGITIVASQGAFGSFDFLMHSTDPNADSSWFDSDFNSWAFANSTPSTLPGYVLLGTIRIESSSSPIVDYNGDGDLDEHDYAAWCESFGMLVEHLGDGADGNENGIVDAADYAIWRIHFVGPSNESQLLRTESVPEPALITFISAALFAIASIRSRRKRSRACIRSPRGLMFGQRALMRSELVAGDRLT